MSGEGAVATFNIVCIWGKICVCATFSPMTSWIWATSPEMLCITSPVLTSVSKNPISCLSTAFRYSRRIRSADLLPMILQQVISAARNAMYTLISREAAVAAALVSLYRRRGRARSRRRSRQRRCRRCWRRRCCVRHHDDGAARVGHHALQLQPPAATGDGSVRRRGDVAVVRAGGPPRHVVVPRRPPKQRGAGRSGPGT